MIDCDHLELSPDAAEPLAPLPWPTPDGAPWTIRRLNRAYTEWVLAENAGNKDLAAQILGIDLSTLYRWQRTQKD